jgi:hypothetical protein
VREIARCAGFLVVAEDEGAPFEIVGARPQRDVDDRAAGTTELGVVVADTDVDGFDGFRRRNQRRQQSGAMVVADAFNLHVVGQARLPVDVGREAVLRIEKLRVRPERTRCARYRQQHPLEVAIEPERHLLKLHAGNDAPGIGAIGLKRRRLADDGDRLLQRTDFHLQVDADRLVDIDANVLADRLLESRESDSTR